LVELKTFQFWEFSKSITKKKKKKKKKIDFDFEIDSVFGKMAIDTDAGSQYSHYVGFIFVFNLIVGVGAISIPQGFQAAGVGLSTIVLVVLAFCSFMATTWVIEAQATANAVLSIREDKAKQTSNTLDIDVEVVRPSTGRSFLFSSEEDEGNEDEDEGDEGGNQNQSGAIVNAEKGELMFVGRRREWSIDSEDSEGTRSDDEEEDDDDDDVLKNDAKYVSGDVLDVAESDRYFVEVDGKQRNRAALYNKQFDHWHVPTGQEYRFKMTRRVEMGALSEIFMGYYGQKFFYLVLIVYLIGDLAIYAVAVPQALARVTGGWAGLSEFEVYEIYLLCFALLAVPFCFFNVQSTKLLQVATSALRHLSMVMLIVLCVIYIAQGKGAEPSTVHVFNVGGFSQLFGTAIYAFMCTHSLSSLLTPVKQKQHLTAIMFSSMTTILMLYLLMDFSAVFAFADEPNEVCESGSDWACQLQTPYTLNFVHYPVQALGTFLALYPVFTLSTNYVIIAVTLRNNLRQFFHFGVFADGDEDDAGEPADKAIVDSDAFTDDSEEDERSESRYLLGAMAEKQRRRSSSAASWPRLYAHQDKLWASLAAIPPFFIGLFTQQVDILVNITGTYAGLFIIFVIPALLAIMSRRFVAKHHPLLSRSWNRHRSPFEHISWQIGLLILSALSLIYIIVEDIISLAT
jgi:amino acid permease